MKFIVTGGAGFVGSHLARYLVKNNHRVSIIDNLERGSLENIADIQNDVEFHKSDVSNYDEIDSIVDNPDGIFHQAALTFIPQSFEQPEKYHRVNVVGTENIFKIAQKHGIKVIFASSSSVYGDQKHHPVGEDAEKHPLNPYGQTKLDDEELAMEYSKEGLEVIGLRYFNVFGIGQNPNYAGVIPRFIERLAERKPPIIEGDGTQTRSFTFVDDVVQANMLAFQSKIKLGFFNVASDKMITINNLAKLMIKLSGINVEPIYDKPRRGDIKKSSADIEKAKNMLGWTPKVSLEEGLQKMFPPIKNQ